MPPSLFLWFRCGALAVALTGPLSSTVLAQTIGIEAKIIHTVSSKGTIKNGVILVEDGKIAAVGPGHDVSIPEGTKMLAGHTVTPGLIDAHSVVGLAGWYNVLADQDHDETSGPNQADLRAIDGFNPAEPLLDYLLRHGVTTIQSGPGRGNPIGGQAGVFKTAAETVEAAIVRFPSAMIFTLGESPKKTYGERKQTPMTRMGTAAFIRKALTDAQAYAQQWERYRTQAEKELSKNGDKSTSAPDRDLKRESLAQVTEGRLPALITAHREDDILTAIRLAKEFEIDLILDAATEGYLVTRQIQAAGVPVIVHPTMQRIDSPETLNTSLENASLISGAGVTIALQSGYEAYVPKTRIVLFEAAIAMVNGLGFDRALRSITADAAETLQVASRVGSIDIGKDADLVLFDGDPFEYTTHVQKVLVEGRLVHDRLAIRNP